MKDEKIYVIHRIYNKDEIRYNNSSKSRIYGWSNNKNIIKAFISQRNKNKYYVEKMYGSSEEILDGYYNDLDNENMINYIKLKSVNSDQEFYLFMTAVEMQEAEINIQKYFRDLCCISDIEGRGNYLEMFMNIDRYYSDALDFIGYRPPEISAMYQSMDPTDDPGDIIGITELIENAYSGSCISPYEDMRNSCKPLGLLMFTDVASKILYSIESFIKVLRDEL